MGATRTIPVTQIEVGDVVVTGDGMAIVRDIRIDTAKGDEGESDSTLVNLLLSAGRTDPGTWVDINVERASVYRDSWERGDATMVRHATTLDGIDRWVRDIAKCAADPEQAHGLEDALYVAVLKAIAGGAGAAELARAALAAHDLEFSRWSA